MNKRIGSMLAACAMAGAFLGMSLTQVRAADSPPGLMTIVVPFPAGGPTDASARVVAREMGRKTGLTFVIENVSGAGGTIGAARVAEAPPDGRTLLWGGTSTLAMAPHLYPKVRYTATSFAPVAFAVCGPMVLAVHPAVKAATIEDLVKLGRSRPGMLNYGSAGQGSATHLVGEMFKHATGIFAAHIAYKGGAPALADVIGGQIDYVFDTPSLIAPMVAAGKVRPLAVTGTARHRLLPDVPTFSETVAPGLEAESWFGLVAPKGTPESIVETLNAMMNDALVAPSVSTALQTMGFDVRVMTRAQYATKIESDSRKWQEVVSAAKIVLE
jgi:tripartite-type tricarboxylate transporter receptor subunit TctC